MADKNTKSLNITKQQAQHVASWLRQEKKVPSYDVWEIAGFIAKVEKPGKVVTLEDGTEYRTKKYKVWVEGDERPYLIPQAWKASALLAEGKFISARQRFFEAGETCLPEGIWFDMAYSFVMAITPELLNEALAGAVEQ